LLFNAIGSFSQRNQDGIASFQNPAQNMFIELIMNMDSQWRLSLYYIDIKLAGRAIKYS
jgi:hypothetical protein